MALALILIPILNTAVARWFQPALTPTQVAKAGPRSACLDDRLAEPFDRVEQVRQAVARQPHLKPGNAELRKLFHPAEVGVGG